MQRKKLPVGIEDFEEIRKEDFYYIDKTGLIRDLLNNWGKIIWYGKLIHLPCVLNNEPDNFTYFRFHLLNLQGIRVHRAGEFGKSAAEKRGIVRIFK